MHKAVRDWVGHCIDLFDLDKATTVLDLGGRDVNGTTRELFNTDRYVVVDQAAHPSVHVVADAATVRLDERFDAVVCTEVLEHTPHGAAICATAQHHLNPAGVFIATMAGPGRSAHGASGEMLPPPGEWYQNVEPAELANWLSGAGFTEWEIDTQGFDLRCWATDAY